MTKTNLRGRGLIWPECPNHTLTSEETEEGNPCGATTSRQEPKQGTLRNSTTYCLAPLAPPSMFLIQFRITCHEWYCLLWTRLDPSHISHQSRELAYAGPETPSLFQDVPSLCQIHSKQRDNNNQHCGLFGFVLLFIVPTVSKSYLFTITCFFDWRIGESD